MLSSVSCQCKAVNARCIAPMSSEEGLCVCNTGLSEMHLELVIVCYLKFMFPFPPLSDSLFRFLLFWDCWYSTAFSFTLPTYVSAITLHCMFFSTLPTALTRFHHKSTNIINTTNTTISLITHNTRFITLKFRLITLKTRLITV